MLKHTSRKTTVARVLVAVAVGTLGLGVAMADIGLDEPTLADSEVASTYDPALGATLPVDIAEGMQAQAPVTTSDELTGEDPSWDDPSVNSPAQPAEIVSVSNVGDAAMPLILPLSIMKPTNGYRFSTDDTGRYVWAGRSSRPTLDRNGLPARRRQLRR